MGTLDNLAEAIRKVAKMDLPPLTEAEELDDDAEGGYFQQYDEETGEELED
jgi:hypothetical protein